MNQADPNEKETPIFIGSIEKEGDGPFPPNWEDILLDFCSDARVPQFFDTRNSIREMMRQREALLAVAAERMTAAKELYTEEHGDWYDDEHWREWLESECPDLAALPEHLR